MCGAGYGQTDWNKPFHTPQYLVHATGHGTIDGPVKNDWYFLYPVAPQNGRIQLPDGRGGTYTYSTDYFSGPFNTPREVCATAGSLVGNASLNAWNSSGYFTCLESAQQSRFSKWWNGLSGIGKVFVIGGAILIACWILSTLAGAAATTVAAEATTGTVEGLLTNYAREKLTNEVVEFLVGKGVELAVQMWQPGMPVPSRTPPTPQDIFNGTMQWGTGSKAAIERAMKITKDELLKGGVTPQMCKDWMRWYAHEIYRQQKTGLGPQPSAPGRMLLLKRAYELLTGK